MMTVLLQVAVPTVTVAPPPASVPVWAFVAMAAVLVVVLNVIALMTIIGKMIRAPLVDLVNTTAAAIRAEVGQVEQSLNEIERSAAHREARVKALEDNRIRTDAQLMQITKELGILDADVRSAKDEVVALRLVIVDEGQKTREAFRNEVEPVKHRQIEIDAELRVYERLGLTKLPDRPESR